MNNTFSSSLDEQHKEPFREVSVNRNSKRILRRSSNENIPSPRPFLRKQSSLVDEDAVENLTSYPHNMFCKSPVGNAWLQANNTEDEENDLSETDSFMEALENDIKKASIQLQQPPLQLALAFTSSSSSSGKKKKCKSSCTDLVLYIPPPTNASVVTDEGAVNLPFLNQPVISRILTFAVQQQTLYYFAGLLFQILPALNKQHRLQQQKHQPSASSIRGLLTCPSFTKKVDGIANANATSEKEAQLVLPTKDWYNDSDILYAIALFYLLLLKPLIRKAERAHDVSSQLMYLQAMVETLEFSIQLPHSMDKLPLQMEIVQALDVLGWLYKESGDAADTTDTNLQQNQCYHQSFVCYTRSLKIKSEIYGLQAHNLDLAHSMETLGVLMRDKLQVLNDSINCLEEALIMKERVYRKQQDCDHDLAQQYADLAQTSHSLGLAFDLNQQYPKALMYYEKALILRKKQSRHSSQSHTSLRDTRKLIATLFNLGCVAEKLRFYKNARSFLEEAWHLQKALSAKEQAENNITNDISRIGTLFRLATVNEHCQELKGAYKYYKMALDIHFQLMEAKQGNESQIDKASVAPLTPRTVERVSPVLLIALLHGSAMVSNQLGHYEDAIFAFESLLEVVQQQEAQNQIIHDKTRLLISTYYHLGLLHDIMGNAPTANKFYKLALERMGEEEQEDSSAANIIRMNILCLPDPLYVEGVRVLGNVDPSNNDSNQRKSKKKNTKLAFRKSYHGYKEEMQRKYNRQDYVYRDAGFAVTPRNLALLATLHMHQHVEARKNYEDLLEVIWYPYQHPQLTPPTASHYQEVNNDESSSSSSYATQILATRYYTVIQTLCALGATERKLRRYDAARHYQSESLALLVKVKRHLQHHHHYTPRQATRVRVFKMNIERELNLLNSPSAWLSFLKE